MVERGVLLPGRLPASLSGFWGRQDTVPIYLKNEKWNQVPEPETQQFNYLLKFAIRNSVNNQIQAFFDVKKKNLKKLECFNIHETKTFRAIKGAGVLYYMEAYSAPTKLSFQQIADHTIFPRKNEINVKPKKLKAIASSKTMQKPTHGTVGTLVNKITGTSIHV